jgi:hypothetical protein
MSEKKGLFKDPEAQYFISSSDSDVTAEWGSTKYQLEKSHSHTIRVYRLVLGLLASLYIISAAFVAWRARFTVAPLLLQQEFIGHSKYLRLPNEIMLMKYAVPKTITTFHNDVEYVEGKFNGIWGNYMVRMCSFSYACIFPTSTSMGLTD